MRLFKLIIFFVLVSCGKTSEVKTVTSTLAPLNQSLELEVYDFDGLSPLINKNDNKTHIVNFWATWCLPCIKELPYFEAINKKYLSENVEVLLVSLDFPNQYEKKLKPYILEHNLKSKVVALNDTDMNSWIPKIDEEWTGAIPMTIIYNNKERKFYEQSFTYEQLEEELKQFINN